MTTALFLLTITAAHAQQAWWGLWNTGQGLSAPDRLEAGTNDQYVRLTAQNSPQLIGGQLHGIRFWVYDKTAVRSASVWVSTAYGSTPVVRQEVSVSALQDYVHDRSLTTVSLDQPYDILPAGNPYANIFVGFTLDLKDTPDCYMLTGEGRGAANSNFLGTRDRSAYGPLAMQVLASGPLIADCSVSLQPVGEHVAVVNGEAALTATLQNGGYEPLTDFDYVVSVDGTPQAVRHYTLPKAIDELGLSVRFPVSYTVPADACRHAVTVTVTNANGHGADVQSAAAGELIAIDQPVVRRTVMEEFTGTWCLNCMRGFAGIGLLQEQYGDRFIPIAVHGDERDPMMVADYYQSQFMRGAMQVLGGYPSCVVDRRHYCDPYCGFNTTGDFQTGGIVAGVLERPTVADLGVTAQWNDSHTAISCDVATRFGYSSDSDPYRLLLVVTADGLKGEGSRWNQRNGYNSYAGTESALLAYAGQGDPIVGMTYNHVAIAVEGVDGGIDGSVTLPLSAGTTQHFVHTLDMSGNQLVQDPARLHVVAMLLDSRDGTLVNAATAAVADASAISAVREGQRASYTYYNINGQRLAAPVKGINILNGHKVIMK